MQKASITRRVVKESKWVVYDWTETPDSFDWLLAYGDRGYDRTGSAAFDHRGRMYAPNLSMRLI